MIGVFDTLANLPKAQSFRKVILSKVKNLREVIGVILILGIVIFGFPANSYAGISLAGTSGLINIPTAEVISDQQVTTKRKEMVMKTLVQRKREAIWSQIWNFNHLNK